MLSQARNMKNIGQYHSIAGTKHYFDIYNEKHNFIEAYYD